MDVALVGGATSDCVNIPQMDANEREILTEIERRKEAKETPCGMCNGYGVIRGHVCHFCLGQRIELSESKNAPSVTECHKAVFTTTR